MLNTLMQSLPRMSAGYIRPVSPSFIEEVMEPDGIESIFEMDLYSAYAPDAIRFDSFKERFFFLLYNELIRLSPNFQPNWEAIAWWQDVISAGGLPEFCTFECINMELGFGYLCNHDLDREHSSEMERLAEMLTPLVDAWCGNSDYSIHMDEEEEEPFPKKPSPEEEEIDPLDLIQTPCPQEHPRFFGYGEDSKEYRRWFRKARDNSRQGRIMDRSRRQHLQIERQLATPKPLAGNTLSA